MVYLFKATRTSSSNISNSIKRSVHDSLKHRFTERRLDAYFPNRFIGCLSRLSISLHSDHHHDNGITLFIVIVSQMSEYDKKSIHGPGDFLFPRIVYWSPVAVRNEGSYPLCVCAE